MRVATAYGISLRGKQEIRRRSIALVAAAAGSTAAVMLLFYAFGRIGAEVLPQGRKAAVTEGASAKIGGERQKEEIKEEIRKEASGREISAAETKRWEMADAQSLRLHGTAAFLMPQIELKTMYLTFDDGPSGENTDKILDVLRERGIRATFFVIGEYVEKFPDTARRIVEEGHTIGIHCYVHDYATLYASPQAYIADFEKAHKTIYEVTGVEATLFRFPGGSVTNHSRGVCGDIVSELESRGFVYFDWNASLEDTVGSKTPEELIACALESVKDRERVVLLAHDRLKTTAECMEELLDALSSYRMEPLNAGIKPVQFRRFWENG
ncbi:MAG: polysaccharide deacetylase [Lachnospiraceae bacterium]|nr:polysaccharide deacetylase [Lachnospiraceae bacterium]